MVKERRLEKEQQDAPKDAQKFAYERLSTDLVEEAA